ncbi:MAG: hypothetical protein KDD06_29345, partial [Phaeodactylibacter sp.]|nr:hypothetical protein [Phaeodactylibacter sp.]
MKAPKENNKNSHKTQPGPFIQRMDQSRHAGAEETPFISRKPENAIQPKLTVNQPGDPYEQEADRMADHIMRMPQTEEGPPMISRVHG